MRRIIATITTALTAAVMTAGAPAVYDTISCDEHSFPDMPEHITRVTEDSQGMIWLSSWNGLYRFDGYNFVCFKSAAGDSVILPSDRFRRVTARDDGSLCCLVDDSVFLFNTRTYRFETVTAEEAHRARAVSAPVRFTDSRGNIWMLRHNKICQLRLARGKGVMLDISPPEQINAMMIDTLCRLFLAGHDYGAVRVLDDGDTPRYLSAYGEVTERRQPFIAPAYAFLYDADGTLWIGTKEKGLFRIDRFSLHGSAPMVCALPGVAVYDIKSDAKGNIWVATLGGGLYKGSRTGEKIIFAPVASFPKDECPKVRALLITPGAILLAATTTGLVVGDIGKAEPTFVVHRREPRRESSLSNNATMNIFRDADGRIFVSTESGGVNIIESEDLTARSLTFRRLPLESDIALSMTRLGDKRIVVHDNAVTLLTDAPDGGLRSTFYGTAFWKSAVRFSDAKPLATADGRWLFALKNGAMKVDPRVFNIRTAPPPLLVTCVNIENKGDDYAVTALDTITMASDERNIILSFAALTYGETVSLRYAFRLVGTDGAGEWSETSGHSAALLAMRPGKYVFEVRSTDDDGLWRDNTRRLTIIVTPRFRETTLAHILFAALVLLILSAIAATYLYIRAIKRRQKEILDSYLALLSSSDGGGRREREEKEEEKVSKKRMSADDEAFMQKVMTFIDANISNSDAGIDDMAAAAANSRSSMTRRLKRITGVTPIELLSKARMEKAKTLLAGGEMNVTETAYACGFTDPKYFSRMFRRYTGSPPAHYRSSPG